MLIMRQKTKRSSIPLTKSFITHKKQSVNVNEKVSQALMNI